MTAPPSTPRVRASGPRRWRLVRAGPDAVPSSVRRFMRRSRRRRAHAALPWATVAAVLLVAGAVGWTVLATSLLGVRQVWVAGARLVTAGQVEQAAAVPPGTPLARVDLAGIQRRVAGLVPVERVAVRRDWPRAVVIEVTERTAVAAVPRGKRFVLVDGAGVAFHEVAAGPAGLPVVRLARPGPGDPDTRAAVQVLAALTTRLRTDLALITVDGPAGIRLTLRDGREVFWGDAAHSAVKAKVATALLARPGGRYDVSAPDVVTIR